jgi:mono/diheme cytochrome c family protein
MTNYRKIAVLILLMGLYACSLPEEIKHIEASKEYEHQQEASRCADLTGEQIFIRSCNTCHPGGKEGLGPSLINLDQKYADDNFLRLLIRKGKGIMPAQPPNVINDNELDHLIAYLRTLESN